MKDKPLNFSFSGIKTSLFYKIKSMDSKTLKNELYDLCASYQEGILNILFDRLKMVINNSNIKNISIVGGVSCNKRFRDKADAFSSVYDVNFHFPDNQFCTDNGAMIAMSAYLKKRKHIYDENVLKTVPVPNIKL